MRRCFPLIALALLLAFCSCSRIGQDVHAVGLAVKRHLGYGGSEPVLVDFSELNIARIGPGTEGVLGIYFSDFVETANSNHIRPARRFRDTADTLLTDKMMPLSHFSRFYGIEEGRIKVGRLDQFADSTTVLPVRNKDCGYIGRITVERAGELSNELYFRQPLQVLRDRREMRRRLRQAGARSASAYRSIRKQYPFVSLYPGGIEVKVYGRGGTLMDDSTVRDALDGKLFLADSLGNAVFVNRLMFLGNEGVMRLNSLLEAHPMCPVIIDNGRYCEFSLQDGNYRDYVRQDLFYPDSCHYVVGSLCGSKRRCR